MHIVVIKKCPEVAPSLWSVLSLGARRLRWGGSSAFLGNGRDLGGFGGDTSGAAEASLSAAFGRI